MHASPGQAGPSLTSLGGEPAPEMLVSGWKATLELPDTARVEIWELLGPVLSQPHGPALQHLAEQFGQAHSVSTDQLAAAMEAVATLIRQAAAHDLPVAQFRADLVLLSQGEHEVIARLCDGYENAKKWVREQAFSESLADHGNLLTGLSWQVGHMQASDRAGKLNRPVVTLTLHHRSGEKTDKTSLQLTPEGIQQLSAFCQRFASS